MEIDSNHQPGSSAVPNKTDNVDKTPTLPSLSTRTDPLPSSLDLILVKLNELDAIKQHLTTIDYRLDHLQPSHNEERMVANRS